MARKYIPQQDIPTAATQVTTTIESSNQHPEQITLERILEDHLSMLYHIDQPGTDPESYGPNSGINVSLHRKRAEVLAAKLREYGFAH